MRAHGQVVFAYARLLHIDDEIYARALEKYAGSFQIYIVAWS